MKVPRDFNQFVNMLKSDQRFCRLCGRPISGRIDKLYCGNTCKNRYHNWLRRFGLFDPINQINKHNWRILSMFFDNNQMIVPLDALHANGFNDKYHTHTWSDELGHQYNCCFTMGWRELEDGSINIIQHTGLIVP